MSIQQPGQGAESAEAQPRADEEHDKDQRAAAEAEVAAYDTNKGSARSAEATVGRHNKQASLRSASLAWP